MRRKRQRTCIRLSQVPQPLTFIFMPLAPCFLRAISITLMWVILAMPFQGMLAHKFGAQQTDAAPLTVSLPTERTTYLDHPHAHDDSVAQRSEISDSERAHSLSADHLHEAGSFLPSVVATKAIPTGSESFRYGFVLPPHPIFLFERPPKPLVA